MICHGLFCQQDHSRPSAGPVAVTVVLCSLVALSVAKGGGGGASGGGAGGYSSAAAGSGGRATGTWGRGGATTAGGSAVVNNGGRAMSPRPRFYNGGAFAPRAPIFLAAGFGAGYLLSGGFYRGSGGYRDCAPLEDGEGRYQYGRNCRKCSDWECPIGQYRQACTPDTDSYCKLCNNKPAEARRYVYTTPGNDNDCEFAKCTTDVSNELMPLCEGVMDPALQDEGLSANSAAEVVFYSEVPLDKETFNANGATFKQAISEVAGGAPVTITEVEAIPSATFTRRRRSIRWRSLETTNMGLGARSVVRESVTHETPQCSAPLPPEGECTQTKCTSPNGEGAVDCWAGNGEPYSCAEGYDSYKLTGETAESNGMTWNEYTCCSAPMSVVVVETTVRRKKRKKTSGREWINDVESIIESQRKRWHCYLRVRISFIGIRTLCCSVTRDCPRVVTATVCTFRAKMHTAKSDMPQEALARRCESFIRR
jgi:hypothetical protein